MNCECEGSAAHVVGDPLCVWFRGRAARDAEARIAREMILALFRAARSWDEKAIWTPEEAEHVLEALLVCHERRMRCVACLEEDSAGDPAPRSRTEV